MGFASFCFVLFFFFRSMFQQATCFSNRSHALFIEPTDLFFFNKIFIINKSYGTIHTFKNYFFTMSLAFSFQQNKLIEKY